MSKSASQSALGVFSPLLSNLPPYFFLVHSHKPCFNHAGRRGKRAGLESLCFPQDLFRSWIKDLGLEPPTLPIEFFSFFFVFGFGSPRDFFWIKYWPLVRKCFILFSWNCFCRKRPPLPLFCGIATSTKPYSVNLVFKDSIFAVQTNLSCSGLPSFFLFAPCCSLHDIPVVFFRWTKHWDRWRNGLVRDPSTGKRSLKHENCCFK